MAERKRPPLDEVESPESKRQATIVNGIKPLPDADMPWKEDIDRYQKDAIIRQMKSYKRECNAVQGSLDELKKRCAYHDDHLRIIDAWFLQLLDEMMVLATSAPATRDDDRFQFKSSLLFANSEKFEEHLRQRAENIKSAMSTVFSRYPVTTPEVHQLQEKLASLLAVEKVHIEELSAVCSEKEQLSESLEKATIRYLSAEKKLDRAKSLQVAKIEAQAIQSSRSEPGSATAEDESNVKSEKLDLNGGDDGGFAVVAEAAHREAVAVASKRAEQVQKLEGENKRLSDDLTSMRAKYTSLSEEDFANSDLFHAIKSQHEDLVKRINDLEARNIQLREEAQQLQAERLAHRDQNDKELETSTIEMQSQVARYEADLARIRAHRDEVIAKLGVKEATESEKRTAEQQLKELAGGRESRISALESENERLRLRVGDASSSSENQDDGGDIDVAALRLKILALEKEYALLSNELPSMAEAYKKVSAIANKKVADLSEAEEKVLRLTAEKAKADQKYFGAMRAKESREAEIRTLRTQNSKSSEIVSQLKEAESTSRQLLVMLEKQLAEAKENLTSVTSQQYSAQQALAEQKIASEHLNAQVAELKRILSNKDAAVHVATSSLRQLEVELTELKTRQEETQKGLESYKKKASGMQTDESEMLRALAICTVCRKNFKDTVLKTCGHLFCHECIEERISSRMRKCPNCGRGFGKPDSMHVTL